MKRLRPEARAYLLECVSRLPRRRSIPVIDVTRFTQLWREGFNEGRLAAVQKILLQTTRGMRS